jgi:hypothetical protein
VKGYFTAVATEAKFVLSVEPMDVAATTITMDIPTAIKAYSMAVVAVSSFKNLESGAMMFRRVDVFRPYYDNEGLQSH